METDLILALALAGITLGIIEGIKPGQVCINGPAALKMRVGDVVIIVAYAFVEHKKAPTHKPTIIFPNELTNSIK